MPVKRRINPRFPDCTCSTPEPWQDSHPCFSGDLKSRPLTCACVEPAQVS
jgi:hypothetical protein